MFPLNKHTRKSYKAQKTSFNSCIFKPFQHRNHYDFISIQSEIRMVKISIFPALSLGCCLILVLLCSSTAHRRILNKKKYLALLPPKLITNSTDSNIDVGGISIIIPWFSASENQELCRARPRETKNIKKQKQ